MTRRELILEALAKALQVRKQAKVSLHDSLCPYDVAQRLGLEVRFVDIGSMEGMYRKSPEPLILISSLRPPGRQNFTCGHEIGHHLYGHGIHIDEIKDITRGSTSIEEMQADFFASFLLMPKTAVERAFAIRGWKPSSCTPFQVYVVAGWLGVGYGTLIRQMHSTLRLITESHTATLRKSRPQQIRARILDEAVSERLVVVDAKWEERTIDLQAGERVIVPSGTIIEGTNIEFQYTHEMGSLYQAIAPGVGRFCNPSTDWASYVRVRRDNYIGRSIYRHEPEYPDEENDSEIVTNTENDYPTEQRPRRAS